MRSDYSSPTTRRRHALVAIVSGLVLLPALIFAVAALIVPVEEISYGNATFWGSVALGSLLAGLLVLSRKRTSLRAAMAFGALTVLLVLLAWTGWREHQAGVQLELVD